MISLSTGQTVVYLDGRSKGCSLPWYSIADIPLMQKKTPLSQAMMHDTLSLESLQNINMKDEMPPDIALRTDTHVEIIQIKEHGMTSIHGYMQMINDDT